MRTIEPTAQLPFVAPDEWIPVRDGSPLLRSIYDRHYSCRQYRDGRRPAKTVGPGEYIALVSGDSRAAWVWRNFISNDPLARGINCAVFRNEGRAKASVLIRRAMQFAAERWPDEPMYTYVDPRHVRGTCPGYCFRRAGWRHTRDTPSGLMVFEATH